MAGTPKPGQSNTLRLSRQHVQGANVEAVDRAPHPTLVATGTALKELRTSQHLSQMSLSLNTGIHRNYIGGIERGEREPTLTAIITIAEELGISLTELFARAEGRNLPHRFGREA